MLNFDATRLPLSAANWERLLEAVFVADPADEDYFIEFKAGLDPTDKAGSATLAKSIVGFGNRDTTRAASRFGGHGLILVGLEPGNLVGAPDRDPAQIHDAVDRWIASPGPDWETVAHTFRGERVVVVLVAPPKAGDPIHCVGRSTGDLVDGAVYVRRPGKTDKATSADIARLSARVRTDSPNTAGVDIDVVATVSGGLRRCTWPTEWLRWWIDAEERRLLQPLERAFNPTPPRQSDAISQMFAVSAAARDYLTREEDRDPDAYRDTVEDYLERCRDAFRGVEASAVARALQPVVWKVTNRTTSNFENLRVDVALQGGATALERVNHFRLSKIRPAAPRVWGPRPFAPMGLPQVPQILDFEADTSWLAPVLRDNGAELRFPSLHLRASQTEVLDDDHVILVAGDPVEVTFTWQATATNQDGVAEGAGTIPVLPQPLDIGEMFEHVHESRSVTVSGKGINGLDDGWDITQET